MGFLGSFLLASPAFADDGIISSFFQSKLNASTERRENIRERLGVDARTPLSADALAIIDQVIQKFTTASVYLAETSQYMGALEDAYTPDANIAAKVTIADDEDQLAQTIAAMVAYRKNAAKETIAEFEAQVAAAKSIIADMGVASLERVEALRTANIPAHLLSFSACSFGPSSDTLYVASNDANVVTLKFAQKDTVLCQHGWNTNGSAFGSVSIQTINGAKEVAKTAIAQNDFGITASATLDKNDAKEDLVAVISDVSNVSANTFIIPLRTHK